MSAVAAEVSTSPCMSREGIVRWIAVSSPRHLFGARLWLAGPV